MASFSEKTTNQIQKRAVVQGIRNRGTTLMGHGRRKCSGSPVCRWDAEIALRVGRRIPPNPRALARSDRACACAVTAVEEEGERGERGERKRKWFSEPTPRSARFAGKRHLAFVYVCACVKRMTCISAKLRKVNRMIERKMSCFCALFI